MAPTILYRRPSRWPHLWKKQPFEQKKHSDRNWVSAVSFSCSCGCLRSKTTAARRGRCVSHSLSSFSLHFRPLPGSRTRQGRMCLAG